ncbi:MAG: excinuclease ABC subunit UvrC [Clostridia bacterium]|nr:excinuclease ABC subunit UvrC [Clostridia bacterium]
MFDIQEELKKLPEKPGVYIMKDKDDNILYVGKAVVLKNRVRQYFQKTKKTMRIQKMVSLIDHFEYIVVDSEMEALILECNLIKLHRPKYNVLLKDDKMYPYIKLTINEDFPTLRVVRKKINDGAKYYGPYTNAFAVKDTVDFLNQTFKLKHCRKIFKKDKIETPCLNYHIKRCLGICAGKVTKEEYAQVIKQVMMFLDGKAQDILKNLKAEMEEASAEMNFEKAAALRDKMYSIENLSQRQKIESYNENDIDVIGVIKTLNKASLELFRIRSGKMIAGENFIFDDVQDIDEGTLIADFMKQFYNEENVPSKIIFRYEFDEIDLLRERLMMLNNGKSVEFKITQKGEKMRFIEMAEKNALISLQNKSDVIETETNINKLKQLLDLEKLPLRIESYDISNISGTDTVAGIIVFENGKPKKNEYRRIKIKTVEGQNDLMCMKETLVRRFRYLVEVSEKNPFGPAPDLVLMDGGSNQVAVAVEVLDAYGLDIPVYGLVKDNKHRTRGIITPDGEELIIEDKDIMNFITFIQDEVHRTAIEYHRKLRDKKMKVSILDDIPGVGNKRKEILLKKYKSLKKISEASLDELESVEGIDEKTAKAVFDFFHN